VFYNSGFSRLRWVLAHSSEFIKRIRKMAKEKSLEEELAERRLKYFEKIDDLFKPYNEMTREEIERLIKDPHYSSRTAEEYLREIAEIDRKEEELFFLRMR
jgi:hypothetical protein